MTIKEKLDELRKQAERSDRLICDLASGKKKWQMCVPPQSDDTDMALSELTRTAIPQLIDALEEMRGALEFYSRESGAADTHDKKGCWILLKRFWIAEAVAFDCQTIEVGESKTKYFLAGKRARASLSRAAKILGTEGE